MERLSADTWRENHEQLTTAQLYEDISRIREATAVAPYVAALVLRRDPNGVGSAVFEVCEVIIEVHNGGLELRIQRLRRDDCGSKIPKLIMIKRREKYKLRS